MFRLPLAAGTGVCVLCGPQDKQALEARDWLCARLVTPSLEREKPRSDFLHTFMYATNMKMLGSISSPQDPNGFGGPMFNNSTSTTTSIFGFYLPFMLHQSV